MVKLNIIAEINDRYWEFYKEEDSRIIDEFKMFLHETEHTFLNVPRINEMIDIEEIIRAWVHKKGVKNVEKTINLLFRTITTEFKVYNVSHSPTKITIFCTDSYRIE